MAGSSQEGARGKGWQPAPAGDAQQTFEQEAGQAIAQQGVGHWGKGTAQGGEHLGSRQRPFIAVQAMLGHVGGLGLQHQLGDVDVGRALRGAHLAIDAQVGHLPHRFRGQGPGVGPRIEQVPHQVGLGARRGRLLRTRPEDRAHALFAALAISRPNASRLRRFNSTVATTVAADCLADHLALSPAQGQTRSWPLPEAGRGFRLPLSASGRGLGGGVAHGTSQRPQARARQRADDLARVEQVTRIEDRLDVAEDRVERAVLLAQPGRPGQAGAVLAADGAAHLQHQVVDLVGQGPHPHHFVGPLQIEERPHVDLAAAGIDQERRRRFVPPQ